MFTNRNNQKTNDILKQWMKTCIQTPQFKIPVMPVKIRDRVTPETIFFPHGLKFSRMYDTMEFKVHLDQEIVVDPKLKLKAPAGAYFWFQVIVLLLLIFFGYETPSIPRLSGNRFQRDNFRDSALGLLVGGFIGFMVLGSLWHFLGQYDYQYEFIRPEFSQAAMELYEKLPPNWLMESPTILIAVIVAFLFLIVVFV